MIYLDNSATTQVRQEVIDAMIPFMSRSWGNPSSIHALGRDSKDAVTVARQQVAALLNCDADEIYFSSCGTLSNNCALLGRARFAEANGQGRHLITTRIEHPSVIGPCQYLESQGWKVTYLPVSREGFVSLKELQKHTTTETSIISVMWANNEVGTIQDIAALAKFAAERDIFFHTDAVQAAGKIPIDLKAVPISALALSGHKFHAPKGVGILYVRKLQNIMPIVFGGGQEMGIVPGTEGLSNIVAIGKAAELARLELARNREQLLEFSKIFKQHLSQVEGLTFTGASLLTERLPGHISFVLPGLEGEAIVMRADLKGLCISSGSACHKGIIEPSSVLKSLGLSDDQAKGSIRMSASSFNTVEECTQAVELLVNILNKMKFGAQLQSPGVVA
ncbi:MAG TPA: cysteine desulfurase family protein [Drouetiella sp.]|jgi:cysteine desulfurase